MLGLRVELEAEEEIAAAIDWYESERPGLGAAFLAEVGEVITQLRSRELVGLTVPDVARDLPVRRVLLTRFPYAVVFIEHAEELHVIAVAHFRRKPGYWKVRLV